MPAVRKKRKRIEECFGWLKTIALLRKFGIAERESRLDSSRSPARPTTGAHADLMRSVVPT